MFDFHKYLPTFISHNDRAVTVEQVKDSDVYIPSIDHRVPKDTLLEAGGRGRYVFPGDGVPRYHNPQSQWYDTIQKVHNANRKVTPMQKYTELAQLQVSKVKDIISANTLVFLFMQILLVLSLIGAVQMHYNTKYTAQEIQYSSVIQDRASDLLAAKLDIASGLTVKQELLNEKENINLQIATLNKQTGVLESQIALLEDKISVAQGKIDKGNYTSNRSVSKRKG